MIATPWLLPICVSPVQVSTSKVLVPLPFVIVNFLLVVALTNGVEQVPFKVSAPVYVWSPLMVTSPVTELISNTVIGLPESQPFLTDNFLTVWSNVVFNSNISPSSPVAVRESIT